MLNGCSCIYFNMFVVSLSHTHTHAYTLFYAPFNIYTIIKNLEIWGKFLEMPIIPPRAFTTSIHTHARPKILPSFPAQSLSSISSTSAVSWSLEWTTEIEARHSMRRMGKREDDVDHRPIITLLWFLTCLFPFFG